MIRYKLLKDCKPGEWVYYECGELVQVEEMNCSGSTLLILTDGMFEIWPGKNCKVYPLEKHTKVIAEVIYDYYKKMHEKNLINGSKWVHWLASEFDKLMELDDNATRDDYQKIYYEIEEQIKTLEYHASFLR